MMKMFGRTSLSLLLKVSDPFLLLMKAVLGGLTLKVHFCDMISSQANPYPKSLDPKITLKSRPLLILIGQRGEGNFEESGDTQNIILFPTEGN